MNASSFPKRRAFAILSSIVLGSLPAGAVVVVNTDFSSDLPGMTFDGVNSGNTAGYGTGGPGDGSRAVHLIDTLSAAGGANSAVTRFSTSTAFSTASPGQSELQISFDMAVTSLSSGLNSNAIPRILIRNTADQTQGVTFGFGVTAASNVILFAAKGDSIAPGSAGLSYNFGTYDTTTFTNNDTNGFVRITLSLLHGGTTVNVSATHHHPVQRRPHRVHLQQFFEHESEFPRSHRPERYRRPLYRQSRDPDGTRTWCYGPCGPRSPRAIAA